MGKAIEGNVVAETYLHVGNSGLTVKVVDEGYGPTLVFESRSFGNLVATHRTHTTVAGLRAVFDVLARAIAHDGYSGPYCHAARAARELSDMEDEAVEGGDGAAPADDEAARGTTYAAEWKKARLAYEAAQAAGDGSGPTIVGPAS